MEPALLLRPEEVAEKLRIGKSTVYELMARGELPSVKIGRSRRIAVAAVERYVGLLTQSQ